MNLKNLAAATITIAFFLPSIEAMAGSKHNHSHGAHKHHGSDHDHSAKHGGQFVEVKGHHGVEMVAGSDTLVFHLTEEGKPMDLAGASFRAVVQSAAGNKVLVLKAEGSLLSAKLDAPLPKGAKIALSGKDGHGHTIQARFVKK